MVGHLLVGNGEFVGFAVGCSDGCTDGSIVTGVLVGILDGLTLVGNGESVGCDV